MRRRDHRDRLPPHDPPARPRLDPAHGRHAACGARVAPGGRRDASPCPPSSSTSPIAGATSPPSGTRSPTPTSPGTATRASGSTCAAAATRTASSRDEYLPLEQDDAVEVIAWLAAQPWCTGAVGMMGHSWGGFNALQVAARRPPALRAIITSCSTDDRYADDIHYMGGALLLDNLRWASTMFAHNSRPPDPAVVGARWREMWLERLRGSGLWIDTWLRHPRRDAFWKHGSVCEDFAAIQCPVLAVGGWAGRLLERDPAPDAGAHGPRQGLIGQWAHRYPHMALPGPAVGFLQLALRWWDTWLKGAAPSVARRAPAPGLHAGERAARGHLRDPTRPLGRGARLALAPHHPAALRAPPRPASPPRPGPRWRSRSARRRRVGLHAGRWCPYGLTPDLPLDQRLEDGGGAHLRHRSAPRAARDPGRAGRRPRAGGGSAGGAGRRAPLRRRPRRRGHARQLRPPQPHPPGEPRASRRALEPGRRYRVRVPLNDVAQAFPAGHRIRLALSTAYWPTAWPAPEPVTLTLYAGASALTLPVRPPDPGGRGARRRCRPLETPPPLPVTVYAPAAHRARRPPRRVDRRGRRSTGSRTAGRHRFDDIDLTVHTVAADRFTIRPDDPLSARVEVAWTVRLARGRLARGDPDPHACSRRPGTPSSSSPRSRRSRATRRSTRSAGSGRSRAIWSDPRHGLARAGPAGHERPIARLGALLTAGRRPRREVYDPARGAFDDNRVVDPQVRHPARPPRPSGTCR